MARWTALLLCLCAGIASETDNVQGTKLSDLKPLVSSLFNDYQLELSPFEDRAEPMVVTIGMSLVSVQSLDEVDQSLTFSAFLEISWKDTRLTWSPSAHNDTSYFAYPQKKLWIPDITILNSMETMNELGFDPSVGYTGQLIWKPAGVFKTSCDIDVTYYPFDTQQCSIIFSTLVTIDNDIELTPNDTILDLYSPSGTWNLLSFTASIGTQPGDGIGVVFQLKLKRLSTYYVITTIVPVLLLSFTATLVFALPADSGEKMGTSITVLLAFAVYLSIVSEQMPQTSHNVSILSVYLCVLLGQTAVGVVMSVWILNLHHRDDEKKAPGPRTRSIALQMQRLMCKIPWKDQGVGLSRFVTEAADRGKVFGVNMCEAVVHLVKNGESRTLPSGLQRWPFQVKEHVVHTGGLAEAAVSSAKSLALVDSPELLRVTWWHGTSDPELFISEVFLTAEGRLELADRTVRPVKAGLLHADKVVGDCNEDASSIPVSILPDDFECRREDLVGGNFWAQPCLCAEDNVRVETLEKVADLRSPGTHIHQSNSEGTGEGRSMSFDDGMLLKKVLRSFMAELFSEFVSLGRFSVLVVTVSVLLKGGVEGATYSNLQTLVTSLFSSYEVNLRPFVDDTTPTSVYMGIWLTSIQELNEIDQSLAFSAKLYLSWTDHRLTWNKASYNNTEYFAYPQKYVWVPDVTISNSVENLNELGFDRQYLYVINSGTVRWLPGGVYHTSCDIDVTYYPFDTQVCTIIFTTLVSRHHEIDLLAHPSYSTNLDYYSPSGTWDLVSFITTLEANSDQKSRIGFQLTLKRKSTYYIISIILPVLFLSLTATLVFALPADSGEKMGTCITVLLAFAVYLTIVSDQMPKTSNSVSILAMYLNVLLAQTAVGVVMSVWILNLHHRDDEKKAPGPRTRSIALQMQRLMCKIPWKDQIMPVHPPFSARERSQAVSTTTISTSLSSDVAHNEIFNPKVKSSNPSLHTRLSDPEEHDASLSVQEKMSWKEVAVTFDRFLFYSLSIFLTVSSLIFITILAFG
ncbi:uncharacterized protein LOC143298618 [Babylonia areolata]|uniref:uncharacterized protein LOC143298618 n=1 Tax=Babylonia areolata TaxID=304850 RepID=UPI003FD5CFB1